MIDALLLSIADGGGGAARSTYRLDQGLQKIGVNSKILVQTKVTDSSATLAPETKIAKGLALLRPTLNALPLQAFSHANSQTFSLQWFPDRLISKVKKLDPMILNLHWVCDGFLQIESLRRFNRPLIWTLHDMWPFTGGCHYSGECDRYINHCGRCPQLQSHQSFDFSSWVWKRKEKIYKNLDLTIVTPSRWLADCAKSSSLFQKIRVEIIPNGLNLQVYKPIAPVIARKILNLPTDRHLIVFSAIQATSDRRKGFPLLQKVLQHLKTIGELKNIELVIMGASDSVGPIKFGYKTHYLGTLKDDFSIVLAYSAANVFVAPSVQDNLPNTVLEAIACGTPCVAFDVGGMPDLIDHQITGYLARPFDVEDFAQGIRWILESPERMQTMAIVSRTKAEQEFSFEQQAQRYRELFKELLERPITNKINK